jgi:DNA gyrase subunit A
MGYPVPDQSDGLHDALRKLIASSLKLSRERAPDGVKTHSVIRAVWKDDPSRSPLELYGDLIRQAQEWVARYPLFEPLGNFGSIHGDAPSGMRYNEVGPSTWLKKLGPAFPQLLANGGFGHSGAIETDAPPGTEADPESMEPLVSHVPLGPLRGGALLSFLPPHNLGEVAKALMLLLDRPDATLSEIREVLPAPDFPTGGILANPQDLDEIYLRGEGTLVLRARSTLRDIAPGRRAISINELPYGVFVTQVVEKVGELLKGLPDFGIVDVTDLTFRGKLHLLLELGKGQPPQSMIDLLMTRGILEKKVEVLMVVSEEGKETRVGLLDLLRSHLERRRLKLKSDSKLRAELTSLALKSDARRTTVPEG